MEQYIPKSALVAEVKKRRDAALVRQHNLEAIGQETVLNEMVANELNRIICFINTLEVKEINLEREIIIKWSKFCLTGKDRDSFFKIAKHFFELGMRISNK